MVLEPVGALQKAHALLGRHVPQLAIQGSVRHQTAERRLALWAPWLLLVHCPVQDAARCRTSALFGLIAHFPGLSGLRVGDVTEAAKRQEASVVLGYAVCCNRSEGRTPSYSASCSQRREATRSDPRTDRAAHRSRGARSPQAGPSRTLESGSGKLRRWSRQSRRLTPDRAPRGWRYPCPSHPRQRPRRPARENAG